DLRPAVSVFRGGGIRPRQRAGGAGPGQAHRCPPGPGPPPPPRARGSGGRFRPPGGQTPMSDTPAPHRPRPLARATPARPCPEALAALQEANRGHAPAYGDDPWTGRARALLGELFEADCEAFFVSTGTAANALAVAALCHSYHSVLCHADAHVQTDECGAPENAGHGIKLVPVAGPAGKPDPARARQAAGQRRDVHSDRPTVRSRDQAT